MIYPSPYRAKPDAKPRKPWPHWGRVRRGLVAIAVLNVAVAPWVGVANVLRVEGALVLSAAALATLLATALILTFIMLVTWEWIKNGRGAVARVMYGDGAHE